jgi:hypothetical protein
METIYNKIVKTFTDNQQVFTDAELIAPRTIDINIGQTDNPEGFEIFYPAIFVSWAISPQANNYDPKLLTLDFHCIQDADVGTENFSGNIAPTYLAWLRKTRMVLNGLRAANTTGLTYRGERPNLTPYFRYTIINFECYIDIADESLTRGTLTTEELDGYKATFQPKQTISEPELTIDTF